MFEAALILWIIRLLFFTKSYRLADNKTILTQKVKVVDQVQVSFSHFFTLIKSTILNVMSICEFTNVFVGKGRID